MLLNTLVNVAAAVSQSRSRLKKVAQLTELVRHLSPIDAGVALAYLTGRLPQGRIGPGPASLEAARAESGAARASLELQQVDAAFSGVAAATGTGSQSVCAIYDGQSVAG